MPRPPVFPNERQLGNFGPRFDRLAEVLARDPNALELRSDPTALAPERLLVFEVRGPISSFAAAVARVPGLELVDEEELGSDGNDKDPVAYLMVPDALALAQLESLWRRWQRGQLRQGETPWRDVFQLLRALRQWGPADRVNPYDSGVLADIVAGRPDDEPVVVEIELIFRAIEDAANGQEQDVLAAVIAVGGRRIARSRLPDISYHALLVELPVLAIRRILTHDERGLSALPQVMHIRPQSLATTIDLEDQGTHDRAPNAGELRDPILALIDGVPVAAHRLLNRHLIVDDQFGLEPITPVDGRAHGTAMASLIIYGDLNRPEAELPRRIHVVPVLGPGDRFPENRLIVDVMYTALEAMRGGTNPTAPNVVIVNLSLGNARRPFYNQLSAWARLLDRLAYRFGVLFIVSAGNHTDPFGLATFATSVAFEDASATEKANGVLRALGDVAADRRVFAPAETVNGVTVGACNLDAVPATDRAVARINIEPFAELRISNPSSALGPGFALSVKPDLLMSGGREHLRVVRTHAHVDVRPAAPSRSAGLMVAAPPRAGIPRDTGYTGGTSAGAAFASRTCHRIYDALEAAYGPVFLSLSSVEKAVLLKALLVHPAKWPASTAALIRTVLGPADAKLHVRQKDNIRRFLGYGIVDSEDAVACATDRATFWATGRLERDKVSTVQVPIPIALGGNATFHELAVTLAWFTPVVPGRKNYRAVRLKVLEPDGLDTLGVQSSSDQPDNNQANRGTLFSRRWTGARAAIVGAETNLGLTVQRDPDRSPSVDEAVPFGLAVTLHAPGIIQVYEQSVQRLPVAQRARV